MAQRRRGWLWLRWIAGAFLAAALLDGLWLRIHWPDFGRIARGPVPASRFMRDWERSSGKRALWQPVPLSTIPPHVSRAVIVAEDARFWGHGGFDVEAFREAMSENVARGRMAFGGSTLSQQTAKNLFLTPSRTPLRKWHELVFTWGLERNLSKRRILEIYLNDAELGPGVYGVEAAAQRYYTIPASALDAEQAIELAATLPSPRKHNPATRTKRWEQRVKKIRRHLERWDAHAPAAPAVTPSPPAAPAVAGSASP